MPRFLRKALNLLGGIWILNLVYLSFKNTPEFEKIIAKLQDAIQDVIRDGAQGIAWTAQAAGPGPITVSILLATAWMVRSGRSDSAVGRSGDFVRPLRPDQSPEDVTLIREIAEWDTVFRTGDSVDLMEEWCRVYPHAIYGVFSDGVLVGAMSLWPITETAHEDLLRGVIASDKQLSTEHLMTRELLARCLAGNEPTHWYVGDVIMKWRAEQLDAQTRGWRSHPVRWLKHLVAKPLIRKSARLMDRDEEQLLRRLLVGDAITFWYRDLESLRDHFRPITLAAFATMPRGERISHGGRIAERFGMEPVRADHNLVLGTYRTHAELDAFVLERARESRDAARTRLEALGAWRGRAHV